VSVQEGKQHPLTDGLGATSASAATAVLPAAAALGISLPLPTTARQALRETQAKRPRDTSGASLKGDGWQEKAQPRHPFHLSPCHPSGMGTHLNAVRAQKAQLWSSQEIRTCACISVGPRQDNKCLVRCLHAESRLDSPAGTGLGLAGFAGRAQTSSGLRTIVQ